MATYKKTAKAVTSKPVGLAFEEARPTVPVKSLKKN